MRLMKASSLAVAVALVVPAWAALLNTDVLQAQAGAQETDRKVAGGGITVKGWTGVADSAKESAGLTVNDAKFAPDGAGFMVQTGPGRNAHSLEARFCHFSRSSALKLL